MEEKFTAYDLEREEKSEAKPVSGNKPSKAEAAKPDCAESEAVAAKKGDEAKPDSPEKGPDADDKPQVQLSESEQELTKMIGEMGAEKLLEIIRGNRNAAIEQIIEEVKTAKKSPLHSGKSKQPNCHSIFDLAELA